MGFFFFCVSIFWIIHIYLNVIVKVFGRPVNPFFNTMLDWFLENNMEFISTVLYLALVFYLLFSAFRGNTKFGL
jgi:hypothetical protein